MTDHAALADAPAQIEGIELLSELGRGHRSVVYRGRRGHELYAVKLLRFGEAQDPAEALRAFRREAATLALVAHPGLPRIWSVGEHEGRPYLVMEHIDGEDLGALLARGRLAHEDVVRIGITLGGVLEAAARHGLVHRDIKPGNILMGRDGRVRLVDFELATMRRQDAGSAAAGTFLYAAPEQSGMLKRPVDARSDLYALGVVLFQCATGSTPFAAADVGELMRQHAVVPAPRARELAADVSAALSAIIARLLAKDPDDRYQSARGLVHDLEHLALLDPLPLTEIENVLGAGDAVSYADDSIALTGRTSELGDLRRAWADSQRAEAVVVVVEGEPGAGKSRLMRELLRDVVRERGLVLQAKCVADEVSPFLPLRQAIERHIATIQRLPSAERDPPMARLRQAALELGPLAQHFSPLLARLVGSVGALDELPEARDQFYELLAACFVSLVRGEGRGVLFVDDVQWLDEASRQVLRALVQQLAGTPLLVCFTVRTDKDSAPARERLLEDFDERAIRLVRVGQLDEEAVRDLVRAHLGGLPVDDAVSQTIASRTAGNPFAIGEYIRAVIDAGLLRPDWGRCSIDTQALARLTLPSDVMRLVVQRLDGLDQHARPVLQCAAALGSSFALDTLLGTCGEGEHVIYDAIAAATRAHLVERVGHKDHAFVHDRVREALLAQLEGSETRRLHQRIAEYLDRATSGAPEEVYSLAQHYALGERHENPQRVYETNLAAGELAAQAFADDEAYTFLAHAREALALTSKIGSARLEQRLGEVCARRGQLAQAVAHFSSALKLVEAPGERLAIWERLADAYASNYDSARARQELTKAFRLVGELTPRTALGRVAVTAWYWLAGSPRKRPNVDSEGARLAMHRFRAIARLYEVSTVAAYFDNDVAGTVHAVVRARRAARHAGPSREQVHAYASYCVLMGVLGWRRAVTRYARLAESVAQRLGDPASLAHSRLYEAIAMHYCGESVAGETQSRRCLDEYGRWLDVKDYQNGCISLAWNLFIRGYADEALRWVERALQRSEHTRGQPDLSIGHLDRAMAGAILASLGRSAEGRDDVLRFQTDAAHAPRDPYRWGIFLETVVLFHTETGELGAALDEAIAAHARLSLNPATAEFHLRLFYIFQAYARLEQCRHTAEAERRTRIEQLRESLYQLRRTARHPVFRCHYLVVRAEYERLCGRRGAAAKWLHRAEALAQRGDAPWPEFEIERARAHLLTDAELPLAAKRAAQNAYTQALRLGWLARARRIAADFHLESTSSSDGLASRSAVRDSTASDADAVRLRMSLEALLEVSLAAASVVDPRGKARVALAELSRLLGAERAYLFLCREGSDELEFHVGRGPQGEDLDEPQGFSRTVVARVRSTQQAVIVSGTSEGSVLGSESVVAYDLRSIVAAPLMMRGSLMGVVYLDNRLARGVFTQDDVQILVAIANHIAIALETARTARLEAHYESEKQQRQLAEDLRLAMQSLSATLDLREVVQRLADAFAKVVSCDGVTVWIHENGAWSAEVGVVLTPERRALLDRVLAGSAAIQTCEATTPSGVSTACLAVPLVWGSTATAVVVLERRGSRGFALHEAEVATTLAGQAAIAVDNARLFGEVQRLAITDALTLVANRRQVLVLAEREVERFRRSLRPLSVMMIDVDHFKDINDQHGHDAGDAVLREIAQRGVRGTRQVDIVGRYGGEEFVVVMPETDIETARTAVAERLRRMIADQPIVTPQGALSVTVSIGVAACDEKVADVAALLKRADTALYQAKAAGRNRVVVYTVGAN